MTLVNNNSNDSNNSTKDNVSDSKIMTTNMILLFPQYQLCFLHLGTVEAPPPLLSSHHPPDLHP